jgi:hypothetical protein
MYYIVIRVRAPKQIIVRIWRNWIIEYLFVRVWWSQSLFFAAAEDRWQSENEAMGTDMVSAVRAVIHPRHI